jgi:uncharacterized protein (TIGR03437 family)
MRHLLLILSASGLFAQQPILYNRGAVNAASLAPFGLPNAPIARGSVFTVSGENLGHVQTQTVSGYPLLPQLGGVSLSVTQKGVVTQTFPISVSATQVYAVMPSTVTAGLATLRLTYQTARSNAITIQIADSAPGLFAISSGGYGPGIIQNMLVVDPLTGSPSTPNPVTIILGGYGPDILQGALAGDDPSINSLANPAVPGQTITIWGTGLGPVAYPDNAAPSADNTATPVTVSIGGMLATTMYAGRAACCAGIDQIVVNVPDDAPSGCWVPVVVNAGGVVSNTTTMAIGAPGDTSCDDPGNPLSQLVQTPGTQAFIHVERVDSIENVDTSTPVTKTLDWIYSRFYTRPDSPYNFDPYMSYPPPGACLVHQTSGDSFYDKSLRGVLPASASLGPQPKQTYNNGSQALSFSPGRWFFSSAMGGTARSKAFAMKPLGANASFTIDPAGLNETALALNPEPPPAWTRPNGLLVVPRNSPLALSFTPGDSAAPTAILLYSYAAATNSTVEVQCLAPAGANTFTISADILANLQPTYQIIDGSYAVLAVGTLGVNNAVPFTNGLAANGILLNSSWLSQSVVLR